MPDIGRTPCQSWSRRAYLGLEKLWRTEGSESAEGVIGVGDVEVVVA